MRARLKIRAAVASLFALTLLFVMAARTGAARAEVSGGELGAQAAPAAGAAPGARPARYRDYRGVSLGMHAEDVRGKLGDPEEKDATQDVFVFSDHERARVYYDGGGKVEAIVIAFLGDVSAAPRPEAVVGEAIEAGADGSMSRLVRFPDEGYWVSYTRTGGDTPSVFVTIKSTGGK